MLTRQEVSTEWAKAVAASKLELPPGMNFPSTPPTFFDGEPGMVYLYEAPLVDHFVMNFWRCSWISTELKAARSKVPIDSARFEKVNEQYRLSLPESSRAEFDLYIAGAPKWARSVGREADDAVALIYEADCASLTGEVTK
ncbi:hypothetical protein [Microbacterium sp. SSM24]|uniref:hypothetical protein n=1 Tax=Microbacterium sp. SSM24 TaxID=2991714 RepID=UPI002226A81D|nr:hypothetical protein [Microbacterium sp. SSM24]MCW3492175.1 hypothetical protein [Microbacterium sp. SSM24]